MSSNIENARVSNEHVSNEQLNEQLDNEHVSDSMNDSMNSSDNELNGELNDEIINELDNWEPLTDFENDYKIEIEPPHREIETEPPHRIRRICDGFMPKISICKGTGYYQVCLNKRTYPYHRILAKHFIPNPNGLPEVDHRNRDKANNSLDNLRWVNRRKNLKNRIMEQYGKHEYTNDKPNDLIEITNYKGIEYPANKYFFCVENQRVVQRLNEHKWRFLKQTKNNCYLRVTMRDINERIHHILMATLIKSFEQCAK